MQHDIPDSSKYKKDVYFLFTAGDEWNAATCKIISDEKLKRNDFVLFQTQFFIYNIQYNAID